MNIESLLQLGFAGAIATYLVIFLVRDVKTGQAKILDVLEDIVKALNVKKTKK